MVTATTMVGVLGATTEVTTTSLRHSATTAAVMDGSIIDTITEVVIISRLHSATTIMVKATVMTLITIKAMAQATGGGNGGGKAVETETPRNEMLRWQPTKALTTLRRSLKAIKTITVMT